MKMKMGEGVSPGGVGGHSVFSSRKQLWVSE
jgi:hypothetical protein